MTFREFLKHRIPIKEIINARYLKLKKLQEVGESVGVVIRHGFERLLYSNFPFYIEDESYPPSSLGNAESIPIGFRELYVVNCASNDSRVTALPKGTSPYYPTWLLALLGRPQTRKRYLAYCNFSIGYPKRIIYTQRRTSVFNTLKNKISILF